MNSPIVQARRYIRKIEAGISRPSLVSCDDRQSYVVKFCGFQVHPKMLFNDYVCSRLAQRLGIPVPDVRIVYIPRELIDMDEYLSVNRIKEGYHFGSHFIKDSTEFFGPLQIGRAANLNKVADIIAFDIWVNNDDRANNPGNLLVTSENPSQIMAIDYGNSFCGPDWDDAELIHGELCIPPFDGEVYNILRLSVEGPDPFDEICSKIEATTPEEIMDCIGWIPPEWGINNDTKNLVAMYLNRNKEKLRETLFDIKKQIPKWR